MKSCTDIKQSRKLAEILPLESADMCYIKGKAHLDFLYEEYKELGDSVLQEYEPCWSLAALLGVLPVSCDDGQHCLALINPNPNDKTEWLCAYEDCKGDLIMECYADNSVDACYEMILKLHELKML